MGKVAGAFSKLISGGQVDISEFFQSWNIKKSWDFTIPFKNSLMIFSGHILNGDQKYVLMKP
jgi:hypothetical protein